MIPHVRAEYWGVRTNRLRFTRYGRSVGAVRRLVLRETRK